MKKNHKIKKIITTFFLLSIIVSFLSFCCKKEDSISENKEQQNEDMATSIQEKALHSQFLDSSSVEPSQEALNENTIESKVPSERLEDIEKSELHFKNLLKGFDYFEGEVYIEKNEFNIRGIRINPLIYELAVVGLDLETLAGYSLAGFKNRVRALAVMTGNFRSYQNLPLGLVIIDQKVYNRIDTTSTLFKGILVLKRNKVDIINRDEYNPSNVYDFALQSGPIIVEKGGFNGIYKSEKKTRPPFGRSFIAIQRSGNVIMAITNEVHLYDLAEFLRDSTKGLDCDVALNFEGGGGEGLIIDAGPMNELIGNVIERRPNAVIVKR